MIPNADDTNPPDSRQSMTDAIRESRLNLTNLSIRSRGEFYARQMAESDKERQEHTATYLRLQQEYSDELVGFLALTRRLERPWINPK
jgi:hypothetical protein